MFWLVGGSSSPPLPHLGKPWHQTSALLKKVFPFENWKKEHHHWIQHILICLCNTFFLDWQFWFYGTNFSKKGIFSLGPNSYKRVKNRKKWTSPRICHFKIIAGTKFQLKLRDLIFWPNLAKKGYFWSKTAKLCFCIYPWCILTILNFFLHGAAQTTTFWCLSSFYLGVSTPSKTPSPPACFWLSTLLNLQTVSHFYAIHPKSCFLWAPFSPPKNLISHGPPNKWSSLISTISFKINSTLK